MQQEQTVKKGQVIQVEIESLALGGKGVAHYHGITVFVDRSAPGQIVEAFVYRKKKRYAEARIERIIQNPPEVIDPSCPHFGTCGGCLHQQIDYELQLKIKQQQVEETLRRLGGFAQLEIHPTLPSPEIYHYRNKMEFSFSRKRWLTPEEIQSTADVVDKDFGLGLHIPGRHDKVLDLQTCLLHSDIGDSIYHHVKKWTRESGIDVYATSDHAGYWRFLVIREGKNTGQFMVNIITADIEDHHANVDALATHLIHEIPRITTIVHNINRKKAQIAVGDVERVLYGDGHITEKLAHLEFRISANSFFQTNTRQARRLYDIVREWGAFEAGDTVYDLYCGTGSIALYIADAVENVVGIELVPQAIVDAKQNSQLNHINNCHFIEGDLKDQLDHSEKLVDQYGAPDTVIIDPPRAGMHPGIPGRIIHLSPKRIVYVSCNPATLARDLKMICFDAYRLIQVQPVDMFPHTPHCEVVTLLEKV